MTLDLGNIYPARKLKELLELVGSVRLRLDETISPVVVLETFQASDEQRGPVEAFCASERTGTGIVGAWYAAIAPQGSTLIDGIPRVFRVRSLYVNSAAATKFTVKIVPNISLPAATLLTRIFQDRRFQSFVPQLDVREQSAGSAALPAGGVDVFEGRLIANTPFEWRPERLILSAGHTMVAFIDATSTRLDFALQWDELDARETSVGYR